MCHYIFSNLNQVFNANIHIQIRIFIIVHNPFIIRRKIINTELICCMNLFLLGQLWLAITKTTFCCYKQFLLLLWAYIITKLINNNTYHVILRLKKCNSFYKYDILPSQRHSNYPYSQRNCMSCFAHRYQTFAALDIHHLRFSPLCWSFGLNCSNVYCTPKKLWSTFEVIKLSIEFSSILLGIAA